MHIARVVCVIKGASPDKIQPDVWFVCAQYVETRAPAS
jgi:hypothetical protein